MYKNKNTEKLRAVIKKKIAAWNEFSTFTINGVRNLSRSDLDMLLMCCDWYEREGNLNEFARLGYEVRSVLGKYQMLEVS